MKKTSLLLAVLGMTASVFAGPARTSPAASAPAAAPYSAPKPAYTELFGPGWHGGFHGLFLTPDSDRADDTFGGGINLDYFVTPFVGFQASGSWADPGTDEIWHNYTVDIVLRAPIESGLLAPYAFAGGGAIVEDGADLLGRAGVGIEFRPTAEFGIFADWVYSFPGGGGGDGDVEDYQMIRAGLKFGF